MSYGQGGPQWSPGEPQWGQQQPSQWGQPPPASTPDWDQLAVEAEKRRQRKRLMMVGGGALATLVVGAAVAAAIVFQGNGGDDGAEAGPAAESSADAGEDAAETPAPAPSFEETSLPPLPKPSEFITDAEKDIAPFTAEEFYGDAPMEIEDRSYALAAVHETENCAEAVTDALNEALAEHGCVSLLRATYTGGDVAVTVGVAQFPSDSAAASAREAATSHLTPLVSGDAPEFCQRGGCRTTKNQVGRYAYFAIAGNADNSADSGEDTPALQAARDGNAHAHARVVLRGEDQASASASALVEERENAGSGDD